MEIKILKECGYEEALIGISLSRNQPVENMPKVAELLAPKDKGHNKFMESIYIWLDITAPRFFWQEADTYRLSTKQSASTMYLITQRELNQTDFEYEIPPMVLDEINAKINHYNNSINSSPTIKEFYFTSIKNILPEGFLQRRIWVMNYKCLRNIYYQRKTHRLPQWNYFCEETIERIEHPELIIKEKEQGSKE